MSIKYRYQNQAEIPTELAAQYVEKDGGWTLNLDGAVEKSKLEELRAGHQAALQQLEEIKSRFEGIDPDQVRALEAQKRKLEEEQALKAGEVEKVIENRLHAQKGDFDKQLSALLGERDTLANRLTAIQIDHGVVAEASKRGLRPTAIPDITARARQTFKLIKGVPTAFDLDHDRPRLGRSGEIMSLGEWVDTLVTEAPHLFEPNAGAGTTNARPQGGVSLREPSHAQKRNPFHKDTWNLTEQMRIERTDPELAAKLRSLA